MHAKKTRRLEEMKFWTDAAGSRLIPKWFASVSIISAVDVLRHVEATVSHVSGRLLDVGCANKPYLELFKHRVSEHVGVDVHNDHYDQSLVDHFITDEILPFPDDSFDTLFCSGVMQFIPRPRVAIGEFFRVLKPGGKLLVTIPYLHSYLDRDTDLNRWTVAGAERLLADHGFVCNDVRVRGGPVRVTIDIWSKTAWKALVFVLPRLIRGTLAPLRLLGVMSPQKAADLSTNVGMTIANIMVCVPQLPLLWLYEMLPKVPHFWNVTPILRPLAAKYREMRRAACLGVFIVASKPH